MRAYLLSIFLLVTNSCHTQFVNGTFQDNFAYDCTAGPSWVIPTDNNLIPERTDVFQSGNAWVDMTPCGNWGNGTWIEQTIPTVINQCYSVTFDLGSYCGWDVSDAGIRVTVDGVQVGERIFNNVFSCIPGTLGWDTFTSEVFVATGTTSTVRFTADGVCTELSPIDGFYACTPIGAPGDPGVIAFDNVVLNSLGASVENLVFENETICPGQSITIGEAIDGLTYVWTTGETTPTINVNSSGTYSFDYTGACSTGSGTIVVEAGELPAAISLGSDTILCSPFSYSMPLQSEPVIWSTGATDFSITVNDYGTYWAISQSACGLSTDSISLLSTEQITFTLEDVFTLCEGDSLRISLPDLVTDFSWNDGTLEREIAIGTSGNYQLNYFDGCAAKQESFLVSVEDCSCNIYIPNSFTASDNGINDVWKPYLDVECDYILQVWNRWGEKVFETNNQEPWTGNADNGAYYSPDGIYVYRLEYRTSKVEWKELTGTVCLIR